MMTRPLIRRTGTSGPGGAARAPPLISPMIGIPLTSTTRSGGTMISMPPMRQKMLMSVAPGGSVISRKSSTTPPMQQNTAFRRAGAQYPWRVMLAMSEKISPRSRSCVVSSAGRTGAGVCAACCTGIRGRSATSASRSASAVARCARSSRFSKSVTSRRSSAKCVQSSRMVRSRASRSATGLTWCDSLMLLCPYPRSGPVRRFAEKR